MKQLLLNVWLFIKEKRRNHRARPAALKRAIKRADRLCRKKKKRYRVLFLNNRYRCITRDELKHKKRAGEFNKNINVTKIIPLVFYDTLTGPADFAKELLTAK